MTWNVRTFLPAYENWQCFSLFCSMNTQIKKCINTYDCSWKSISRASRTLIKKMLLIFFKKSLKIQIKLSLKTAVFNLRLGENTVAFSISPQGSPVWEYGVVPRVGDTSIWSSESPVWTCKGEREKLPNILHYNVNFLSPSNLNNSQNSSSACHVYLSRHLVTATYNPAHDTSNLTQSERRAARPQSLSVISEVREKYQGRMGFGPLRPAPKYRNEAVVNRLTRPGGWG